MVSWSAKSYTTMARSRIGLLCPACSSHRLCYRQVRSFGHRFPRAPDFQARPARHLCIMARLKGSVSGMTAWSVSDHSIQNMIAASSGLYICRGQQRHGQLQGSIRKQHLEEALSVDAKLNHADTVATWHTTAPKYREISICTAQEHWSTLSDSTKVRDVSRDAIFCFLSSETRPASIRATVVKEQSNGRDQVAVSSPIFVSGNRRCKLQE